MLPNVLARSWSLAVALVLPVIELSLEPVLSDRQISRAVLSAVCLSLLTHSWFMQRRFSESNWRLGFLSLLLSVPALGCVWLGLNVIRGNAYPSDWTHAELYENVCALQNCVEWVAKLAGIAILLWLIIDAARLSSRRVVPR